MPTTMPASPAGDLGAGLAAGRGLQRTGQQGDAGAVCGAAELAGPTERAEQLPDAAGVLGGEHLGGRQQRGLTAGVDHLGHRPQRDHGLARTDLALQQPVHRVLAAELAGQLLAPTSRCPSVSSNGQGGVEGVQEPAGPPGRAMPGSSAAARRRAASVSCRVSASSHLSRWPACSTSSSVVGRWMSSRAAGSESNPCRARISSGSGSTTSDPRPPAPSRRSLTDFWITQLETSLLAG